VKDLKNMYQERADEIADKRFDKDFYDLDEKCQLCVYNEAMAQISEELICRADSLIDELWLQEKEEFKNAAT